MQILQDTIDPACTKISIVLNKEDCEKDYKKYLEKLKKIIHIEGFRPGKAPLSTIEKNYGPQLMEEVVFEKSDASLQKHIQENGLNKKIVFPFIRLTKSIIFDPTFSTPNTLEYVIGFHDITDEKIKESLPPYYLPKLTDEELNNFLVIELFKDLYKKEDFNKYVIKQDIISPPAMLGLKISPVNEEAKKILKQPEKDIYVLFEYPIKRPSLFSLPIENIKLKEPVIIDANYLVNYGFIRNKDINETPDIIENIEKGKFSITILESFTVQDQNLINSYSQKVKETLKTTDDSKIKNFFLSIYYPEWQEHALTTFYEKFILNIFPKVNFSPKFLELLSKELLTGESQLEDHKQNYKILRLTLLKSTIKHLYLTAEEENEIKEKTIASAIIRFPTLFGNLKKYVSTEKKDNNLTIYLNPDVYQAIEEQPHYKRIFKNLISENIYNEVVKKIINKFNVEQHFTSLAEFLQYYEQFGIERLQFLKEDATQSVSETPQPKSSLIDKIRLGLKKGYGKLFKGV